MTRIAKEPVKAPNLGALIDEMAAIRDQRRAIEAQDVKLKADYDAIDAKLVALLKTQGLKGGRGSAYTASISESEQFSPTTAEDGGVDGWPLFMAFVAKGKLWHLVQRRVSAPAVREVVGLKGAVPPGLKQFKKEVISLRKL